MNKRQLTVLSWILIGIYALVTIVRRSFFPTLLPAAVSTALVMCVPLVFLPTYAFYTELMAHYPAAKVILTVRDPEAWYKSAAQTIFRLPPPPLMILFRMVARFSPKLKLLTNLEPVARKVGVEYFFKHDLSKANVINVFNQHNETVQRRVPPDRLLVYDVKQGWEPLCAFLDVPVPAWPFPHQNTRQEFVSRRG